MKLIALIAPACASVGARQAVPQRNKEGEGTPRGEAAPTLFQILNLEALSKRLEEYTLRVIRPRLYHLKRFESTNMPSGIATPPNQETIY